MSTRHKIVLLISVFLTLLLPVQSWAAVTFFWRCEGTTLDATHDFTAGTDSSGTAFNTPAIDAAAALVGSNGILINTNNESYRFNAEEAVTVPAEGSMLFWVRWQTWSAGETIFVVRGTTGTNNIVIYMSGSSGAGNLQLVINDGGGSQTTLSLDDGDIALNTTYIVSIQWHAANDDRRIALYDATGALLDEVEDLATAVTAPGELAFAGGMRFGQGGGLGSPAFYMDNFFIGSAYTDAATFLTNRGITTFTAYDAGGGGAGGSRLLLMGVGKCGGYSRFYSFVSPVLPPGLSIPVSIDRLHMVLPIITVTLHGHWAVQGLVRWVIHGTSHNAKASQSPGT